MPTADGATAGPGAAGCHQRSRPCQSPTGNRPRRGCAARRCHGPRLALSWLARARPRRQHGRRVVGRPGHPVFGSRLGVGIAVVLAGFATVGRRVILAVVALVGIADTLLHAMCNIGLAFGGWFNAVVAISGIGTDRKSTRLNSSHVKISY